MKRQPPHQDPEDAHYEIGYGKPPKATQFKPGKSGNPKGRPKAHKNLTSIYIDALTQKVTIREGNNKTRKIPVQEAIVRRVVSKAVSGDQKSIDFVLKTAKSLGLFDVDTLHQRQRQARIKAAWERLLPRLSDDDLEVLERFSAQLLKESEDEVIPQERPPSCEI